MFKLFSSDSAKATNTDQLESSANNQHSTKKPSQPTVNNFTNQKASGKSSDLLPDYMYESNQVSDKFYKTQFIEKHDWKNQTDEIELNNNRHKQQSNPKVVAFETNYISTLDRLQRESSSRNKQLEQNSFSNNNQQNRNNEYHSGFQKNLVNSELKYPKEQFYHGIREFDQPKQIASYQQIDHVKSLREQSLLKSKLNMPQSENSHNYNNQTLTASPSLNQQYKNDGHYEQKQDEFQFQFKYPLVEKQNQSQEVSLVKKMREFAELKKKNLVTMEQSLRKQGLSFINQNFKSNQRSDSLRQNQSPKIYPNLSQKRTPQQFPQMNRSPKNLSNPRLSNNYDPFSYNQTSQFNTNSQIFQQPLQLTSQSSTDIAQNIYERLHFDAKNKQQSRKKLQDLQKELEMKNCTFKPLGSNFSIENQSGKLIQILLEYKRTPDQIFERLYKTQLIGKHDWKDQKDQMEIQHCTFQPQLTPAKDNEINCDLTTFDRLFREADTRNKCQELNQMANSNIQLKQCTFQPTINRPNKNHDRSQSQTKNLTFQDSNLPKEEVYDRLHRQNLSKQRILLQKQLDHEKSLIDGCSFKPKINVSLQLRDENHIPAYERLYQNQKIIPKTQEDYQDNYQAEIDQQGVKKNPDCVTFLTRMREFAEKKKKNLVSIEQNLRQQQGLTFKPEINKNIKQRSNSFQRLNHSPAISKNSSSRIQIPLLGTQMIKSPKNKSNQRLSKYYDQSAYCETAYFNANNDGLNRSSQKSNLQAFNNHTYSKQQVFLSPKILQEQGFISPQENLFSLENNLLLHLDTETKEQYMDLQIGK